MTVKELIQDLGEIIDKDMDVIMECYDEEKDDFIYDRLSRVELDNGAEEPKKALNLSETENCVVLV